MAEQNISEQLKNTLEDYNGVLLKCTEAMETNSDNNKAKIGEISILVKEIKQNIMNANDKLKMINENRKTFEDTAKEKQKQLEITIQSSQDENSKKMAELENKRLEEDRTHKANMLELQKKTESELEAKVNELNRKHEADLKTKMDEITQKDNAEKERVLAEQERLSAEKIRELEELKESELARIQDDIEKKKNELLTSMQDLEQTNRKLDEIKGKQTSSDENIVELEGIINELNEKIRKKNEEDDQRIVQFGEEKKRMELDKNKLLVEAEDRLKLELEELRKTHDREMEEAQTAMENIAKGNLERAVNNAVEEVKITMKRESDEKVSASRANTQTLQEQVDECKKNKEKFTTQLLTAQQKIKDLERSYDNQEGIALDRLKKDVVGTLNDDVEKLQQLLADADETIEQSRREAGTDATGGDEEGRPQQTKGEDIDGVWKKYIDETNGEPYYHNKTTGATQWEDPREEKAKVYDGEHPLEIHPRAKKEAMDRFNNIKEALTNKKQYQSLANENFELQKILIGKDHKSGLVKEYVDKIKNEQLNELTQRIVDPKLHGMDGATAPKFQAALTSVFSDSSTKHHKQHHTMYFRILKSMIENRGDHYESLAKEIESVGFEKTFEQLLTAFHLAWGDENIKTLYSLGHLPQSYDDKVFKRYGEIAINIWDPEVAYWKVRNMISPDAPPHIKNDTAGVYAYYGAHDHRKGVSDQGGGFRHGKNSKKQNRRSLKSKLKAKKYSLKSKKKGKNKSKKRRKSIKIRIN